MTLSQFQIKASSLLARLRLLNILVVCLRHLTPRRLDAIFDLKPVLPALSFAILCCTLLIPALVQSADIPRISPKAVITAVTVYQDRAMTTRQVTVNLPAGSHLVVFEGLPSIIQDDSVRVSGKGTAGATIAGFMPAAPGKASIIAASAPTFPATPTGNGSARICTIKRRSSGCRR